nr:(4Fe-4S)-binding protein [Calditrichota bacterium]
RLKMREDPDLKQALYCVRCSACMNVCPVFQVLGGHAFGGETYSGGIGGAWEAGTGTLLNARFSELCTGCSRCVPQCPVRIDIPWLNTVLHDRLNRAEGRSASAVFFGKLFGSQGGDRLAPLEKQFFGNYAAFAKVGSAFAPLSNALSALSPVRTGMEKTVGMHHQRLLPKFQKKTFQKQYRGWQRKRKTPLHAEPDAPKVLIFADIYTNFLHPESGMATVRVLDSLGAAVQISDVLPEGRAALSQGMVETAARRARSVARYLEKKIDAGWTIVVPEPSVLALFRRDYKNLLKNNDLFETLQKNSFGAVEYLTRLLSVKKIRPQTVFNVEQSPFGKKIFYHGHCQRKSLNGILDAISLFKEIGFDVVESHVECCGMAGSFGYKKEFYNVSMRIGEELFHQIREADGDELRVVIASGISCRHQITEGVDRHVFHPMEVLEKVLAG